MKLTNQERLKVAKFTKKLIESRQLSEAGPKPFDIIKHLELYDSDEMFKFLVDLSDFFYENADTLTNMEARKISRHISSAAELVGKRSGN